MGREGGGGGGVRGWPFGGANLGWSDQPRLRQPAKEQGRGAAWPLILETGHFSPGPDGGGASLDSATRRQPPRSEFRGPKPERRPNTEGRSHDRAFRISGFGLLSALGFRASGLGFCAHGLVVLSRYAHGGALTERGIALAQVA